jgi:DNA adenine methylase
MKPHKPSNLVPFSHPGSKKRLASTIVPLLETIPHTRYVEPFFGAGAVFFAKAPVAHEVLNDVNGELINLLRQLHAHPEALIEEIARWPHSRDLFKLLKSETGGTELQRAARWWRIKQGSFGGKAEHFGRQAQSPLVGDRRKLKARFNAVRQRLTQGTVTLEAQDYRKILEFYDGPEALFYFDPPYIDVADVGYAPWRLPELAELARLINRLEGGWFLSINDRADIRALFKDCQIMPLSHRYTLCQRHTPGGKEVTELLIASPGMALGGVTKGLQAA